ncbi:hypothetical protein KJ765_04940 [Candidatus Micrarchaeota archaeon]|nr:hypothetical protein [Candidatus Micrarchaeota archaeon]
MRQVKKRKIAKVERKESRWPNPQTVPIIAIIFLLLPFLAMAMAWYGQTGAPWGSDLAVQIAKFQGLTYEELVALPYAHNYEAFEVNGELLVSDESRAAWKSYYEGYPSGLTFILLFPLSLLFPLELAASLAVFIALFIVALLVYEASGREWMAPLLLVWGSKYVLSNSIGGGLPLVLISAFVLAFLMVKNTGFRLLLVLLGAFTHQWGVFFMGALMGVSLLMRWMGTGAALALPTPLQAPFERLQFFSNTHAGSALLMFPAGALALFELRTLFKENKEAELWIFAVGMGTIAALWNERTFLMVIPVLAVLAGKAFRKLPVWGKRAVWIYLLAFSIYNIVSLTDFFTGMLSAFRNEEFLCRVLEQCK